MATVHLQDPGNSFDPFINIPPQQKPEHELEVLRKELGEAQRRATEAEAQVRVLRGVLIQAMLQKERGNEAAQRSSAASQLDPSYYSQKA